MFEIGLSQTPVIRDGITSDRTYVILACKVSEQYNAIVWGLNSGKLKFYPNAEFWGVTPGVLGKLGLSTGLYSRGDYQGVTCVDSTGVQKVLNMVSHQRATQAVDEATFLQWVKSKSPRDTQLHPSTRGTPNKAAFKAWDGARRCN